MRLAGVAVNGEEALREGVVAANDYAGSEENIISKEQLELDPELVDVITYLLHSNVLSLTSRTI